MDTGSPVSDDYASPNPFTGTLKKVEIHLDPVKLDKAENERIRKAERDTASSAE